MAAKATVFELDGRGQIRKMEEALALLVSVHVSGSIVSGRIQQGSSDEAGMMCSFSSVPFIHCSSMSAGAVYDS